MVPSRLLASRRLPQSVYPTPPTAKCFSPHFRTLRRRGSRTGLSSAAAPDQRTAAADCAAGQGVAQGHVWGEKDFGSLQKKASSRLHRFYVPQPLGPKAATPSLDVLLSAAVPPAESPARASPTVASAAAAAAAGGSGGPPPSVVLEGEEARHAARSLRLQPGDRVELCDGVGNLVEGVVSGSDRQRVWVAPDGPYVHVPWRGSRWVVAVACTTLKGGRAEWLVEKLTELGAFMMVPLVTERSQAGGKAKFRTRGSSSRGGGSGGGDAAAGAGGGGDSDGDYQPGRLERVAIAATKQSLRPHALQLTHPISLTELLPLVRTTATAGGGSGGGGVQEASPVSSSGSGCGTGSRCGLGGDGGGVGDAVGGKVGHGPGVNSSVAPGASGGRGGRGGGGGGSFCLVAVAGAPPLAAVLREVRGRAAPGGGAAGDRDPVDRRAMAGSGADDASEAPLRVLFVGPEGDFTPAELAALVEAGARPVGLGANRLRTETAAVGLLAACLLTEEEEEVDGGSA